MTINAMELPTAADPEQTFRIRSAAGRVVYLSSGDGINYTASAAPIPNWVKQQNWAANTPFDAETSQSEPVIQRRTTATSEVARERSVPRLSWRFKEAKKFDESLVALQKWEGIVKRIGGDKFTAELRDLTNPSDDIVEEADFPIAGNVRNEDRDLLVVGAIFYWIIGQRKGPGRPLECPSVLTFRRVPAWTAEDIEAAKKQGERLYRELLSNP